MKRPAPGEWVYHILLRVYPRRFRRRYGEELLDAFAAQRYEPEYRGPGGSLRFWRHILRDWVGSQVAARRSGSVRGAYHPEQLAQVTGTRRWEVGMDVLKQDLAFALRSLLRTPVFTLIAVTTLAVGIGSNAAIFGVVRSVLLRPLPYGEPEGVVTIWSQWAGFPKSWVSEAEYRTYVTQTRSFDDLALWSEVDVNFTDPQNPERVGGVGTTENLIDVLGVEMALGRFFTTEEALRTDSLPTDVIVISHSAWRRRWAGDPAIVGSTTEMNGRSREVIGVLPEGFRLPTEFGRTASADVYFPLFVTRTAVTDYPDGGGSHGFFVVGRLRDGVSVEAARRDVEQTVSRVGNYPPDRNFRPLVYGAADDVFGTIRPALVALLVTVAFVLLIACANVANLLLARGDDRADELDVRAALGAGRGRLVTQLLVESVVLAVLGGLAGIALATGAVDLFKRLNPGNLPRIDEVALDGTVLAAASAVTLGAALLFGVLPALRSTRGAREVRGRGHAGPGVTRSRWQGALVAAQMALAVVLVVGAGLMGRTFTELTSIEPGFSSGRTLTLALSLPTTRYPDPQAATEFYREAVRRIAETPGVRSVSMVRLLPLASSIGDWGLDVEGYDESVNPRAAGDWQIASPGYFGTIGIPLVEGRDFRWDDDHESSPVGIVNEAFVRRYWPGQEPLGRVFVMRGTTVTVVGVAGNVTHNGLTAEIKPKFYIPVAQWGPVTGGIPTSMRFLVAAQADPADLIAPVRSVIRELDPSLAVAEVQTLDDVLGAAVAQPRFLVVLMGAFSFIALLLAGVGIYGVVSYGVSKRTREIGVRMALGAVRHEVVGLMLRKGAPAIALGLAAGLGFALLLSRYLESLLYGVTPADPVTYFTVAAGVTAVAWLATWLPSRRAAGVDPIRALKSE